MMADDAQIHPWSLISVPCEHINISPEKLYQLFLLLWRQLSFNLKKLLRIVTYKNFLQILAFRVLSWPIDR